MKPEKISAINQVSGIQAWNLPNKIQGSLNYQFLWDQTYVQDLTNRPLEHTPNPQPTVYEGIPFIWGFGDVWGMLQGYVGFPLEYANGMVILRDSPKKIVHCLGW